MWLRETAKYLCAVGFLGSTAVFFYVRWRVNQQLAKSMRITFPDNDARHVMEMHKQFYPENPLRFWYWGLLLLGIASLMLLLYLDFRAGVLTTPPAPASAAPR